MGNDNYDSLTPAELRLLLKERDATIKERERYITFLEPRAFTDELSGLHRRWYGEYLLKRELEQATDPNRGIRSISVFYLDGNGLKKINDKFGHSAGDDAIIQIARSIPSVVRLQRNEVITCWRSAGGGDEFIIAFRNTEKHDLKPIAQRILTRIGLHPFRYRRKDDGKEEEVHLSACIGMVWWPNIGLPPSWEELYKIADDLCMKAKSERDAPGSDGMAFRSLSPSLAPL